MIVTLEAHCKGMEPISIEIEISEIEEANAVANEILREDKSVNKVVLTRDNKTDPLQRNITYTR